MEPKSPPLDMYLDLYKFEIERFETGSSGLEAQVGLMTGVATATWFVVSDAVSTGAVSWPVLSALTCAAGCALVALGVAAIYVARAHLQSSYARIGMLSSWEEFREQVAAKVGESPTGQAHINAGLAKRLCDARDTTARANTQRGELIWRSRSWTAIGVVILVLMALVRVGAAIAAKP